MEPHLSTCDIKSLCTNIRHDLFDTAVEYWTDNCKMSDNYCDVPINNLSLKDCPLF